MTITVTDPATIEILINSDDAGVKLYGPDGTPLGRFVPAPRTDTPEPHIVIVQGDSDPN
jgi:hypothetical protein